MWGKKPKEVNETNLEVNCLKNYYMHKWAKRKTAFVRSKAYKIKDKFVDA